MACTGRQSYVFNGSRFSQLVCEPTQKIERLIFDLPATVPPQEGVDVVLKFTMNGGPWPASTPGRAGRVHLSPLQAGAPLQLDVPTTPDGELRMKLPVGKYSGVVMFVSGTPPDVENHPPEVLVGTLEVVAAGTAAINVDARRLDFSVLIDSAPAGALAPDESMTLMLKGSKGSTRFVSLSGSKNDRLQGRFALMPDTYTAELSVTTSNRYPNGTVILEPTVVVGVAPAQTAQLSTRTLPLSGRVVIDGADLPSTSSASVSVGGETMEIGTARPARYSGRVFPGRHDISLTIGGLPMLQHTTVPVTKAFQAGPPTFDIVVTTVPFSAEVRLNGAQPPAANSSRGRLSVGGASFDLGAMGPAVVSGRVFQLPVDVQIEGHQGGGLPTGTWTIEKGFRPSGTPRVFDVRAGHLRSTLHTMVNRLPRGRRGGGYSPCSARRMRSPYTWTRLPPAC